MVTGPTPTDIERSLLYTVVQVPVREFSAPGIRQALGCWQWLLTKRPDLEYLVRCGGHYIECMVLA